MSRFNPLAAIGRLFDNKKFLKKQKTTLRIG